MYRIFPPTRYDSAPYKTICTVKGESNMVHQFIQMSDDEKNPKWITMGDFFYKALSHKINDQIFIDECIKEYYR